MKFLQPIAIDDAALNASTLPETPPAAYAGGTTYAADDEVYTGTVGGALTVWRSLQSANTGNTPASSPTWWEEIGATYAAWDSGATYAADDVVLVAATHRLYRSVQGANTNHNPTTDDGTWWLDIAPTNRWGMFDQVVGTVSVGVDPIVVELEPAEPINSLALLNLVAESVQIEVEADSSTVYDETFDMEDRRLTMGWWEYFFEPLAPQTELIVSDLPPTGVFTVTINGTACGTLVLGRMYQVGRTRVQPDIGIIDYSVKETDAYGATRVVERAYAKRFEVDVIVEAVRVDAIAQKLADIRATPVVWVGDDAQKFNSLTAFGFYKDWGINLTYPAAGICEGRLTIESLT